MLKKVVQFNAGDFGAIAAVGGGLFLLLQIIINVIMLLVKPDTVPTLSGVLVPILLGLVLLFFFIGNVAVNFDLLLRYSVTRARALGSLLCLLVLEAAEAAALSLLLAQADRFIAQAWVHARPELTIEEFSIPLWGLILGYMAVLLLGLVSGAALLRFGNKAFWVLWAGWMFSIFVMNAGGWEKVFHGAVPADFGAGAITALLAAALLILAAAAWSVHTLLHVCVRNG